MRLTVAIPPMHRSSLEASLGHEVRKVLEWTDAAPADVVLGLAGEGFLAHCAAWPGEAGALALIKVGYERLVDRKNMGRLHEVGKALASEQDLDRLLDQILTHGRNLLLAEAGSIYLVEEQELLFAHTQNAKVNLPYQKFRMPITVASMAGFVALTGETLNIPDVYGIPPEAPYRFNDSFDRQAGYRTASMLVVPIRDTQGEILGVLQFINRLEELEAGARNVPFHPGDEHLAQSLAGQAGVAIKNAKLRKDIEVLFEKFVDASVKAIEQRDPVTRGHSGRVAELTVGLAEAVNRTEHGRFGGVFFSDRQLRELRYASLLHDFGKVGVREQVLVKSKKLEPDRLEILLQRVRQRQQEELLAYLRADWAQGAAFDPARWAELQVRHEAETMRLIELLKRSNEPTVMSQDVEEGLGLLEKLQFTHWRGTSAAILDPSDLVCLSIRRGSLSDAERLEIESHVTHTYEFLSKIPWTADLAGIPEIAYAHHERLNGKGYPRRLGEADIPVQSKAMAITDVFDALTAQDRPYKSAVPLERSLDILSQDAASGHLDADLLGLFVDAKVYERTVRGA